MISLSKRAIEAGQALFLREPEYKEDDHMSAIEEILKDVPLPKMYKARQIFDDYGIRNIPEELHKQLSDPKIRNTVKPGMRIAITCGSRGIDNYALVIKEIASFCIAAGAEPFIVPAMGSHGGATAEGQLKVCESYGVTQEYCGCPVMSSMRTVQIGQSETGHPVFIDHYAARADGIIVVNRVKTHTGFSAAYESGLMKMLTIGLGKQYGASVCHKAGYSRMPELVLAFGKTIIKNANVLFAVGLVENAFGKTCRVRALRADEIEREEPKLLELAKERAARLLPGFADALVVDWVGKNISGAGMDSKVIGRSSNPFFSNTAFAAGKIAALNLTPESHGNIHGIGSADVINRRIFDKGDLDETYPNGITSTTLSVDKIPVMMANDRLTIQCAIKTCNCDDIEKVQLIRIKDTLRISEILVSEAMVERIRTIPNMEIISDAMDWRFDDDGNLTDI